jgi:hypothetical protein
MALLLYLNGLPGRGTISTISMEDEVRGGGPRRISQRRGGSGSEDETQSQTIITRKKVGQLLFLPTLERVYANNSVQKVSPVNKIETIRIAETIEDSCAYT